MKRGRVPSFIPQPSALIPFSRGLVDRLVLVAHAEGRAKPRAYPSAEEGSGSNGLADEEVALGDDDAARARARAAADGCADERALQARLAAVDLPAGDAVARERDLPAVAWAV